MYRDTPVPEISTPGALTSLRNTPNLATTNPNAITPMPVRIQASSVRSAAK
jgi:hypothetical protein